MALLFNKGIQYYSVTLIFTVGYLVCLFPNATVSKEGLTISAGRLTLTTLGPVVAATLCLYTILPVTSDTIRLSWQSVSLVNSHWKFPLLGLGNNNVLDFWAVALS